jgi:hypothetical protein
VNQNYATAKTTTACIHTELDARDGELNIPMLFGINNIIDKEGLQLSCQASAENDLSLV